MKSKATLVAASCLLWSVAAFAQGQGAAPPPPPPPAVDTVAPDIPGVVKGGTKVQVIKEGFTGTEGPIALPDGSVIFTETAANRITKIDKNNNISTFLENTNGSNGLAFDSKGRLITVQTTPKNAKVGVIYPKGAEAVIADSYDGKPLARPNDLVVAKNGGVYFTDPDGMPPAVYYVPPGGKPIKLTEDITRPNGIQLSRDEKTLYVNNTFGEYLMAFDVRPDGTVTNGRTFAKYERTDKTPTGITSGADGLAIDNEGRVYVATLTGVQVFSPQGQRLGTIPVSRPPQNIAFAGPDKKTLYIVGRGAAYKVQLLTEGFKGRAK
jgi:gluconolactonase